MHIDLSEDQSSVLCTQVRQLTLHINLVPGDPMETKWHAL